MTWQTVTVFYFKRCFRIYPALFFATALTILYIFMFHGHPMPTWSSMWWGDTRNEPIVARNIARAALGLGKLDPMPVWTLFIELVGSAILPPMVFILIRSRLLFLFVTLLLLLLSFVYGQQVRLHFGVYLIDFAIGAGLTSILPITERLLKARSVLFVRFLALAFFLAFWLGRQIGGWSYVPYYDAPLPALLEAVGGAMLLAIVCARHDLFSFLRARPLERLGDISYSLYLIHPTVMFFIATIGGEVLAMDVFYRDPLIATLALIASTITVSVGVAALSYRYIELSGIRFGQLLQARASDGVRAK
jgi:peptidoglycan/LPS O-acetylase OafA/YrhL